MPFCNQCGKQLDTNDRFCSECKDSINKPQNNIRPEYNAPSQTSNKSKTNIIVIVAIIFAVIVIIMTFWMSGLFGVFNDPSKYIEIVDYEIGNPSSSFYSDGNYEVKVQGTAKNTGNSTLYVTIRAKFYDKDNIFLGWDDALNERRVRNYKVPPGYSWDFRLMFYDDFANKVDHIEFVISAN